MKVDLDINRQRFEISLGLGSHVFSLDEAKQLADWIYELHPTAKSRVQAMREFMALLYLGIQDDRNEKFEAMDEQTKLLINEVWFDQLEEDGEDEYGVYEYGRLREAIRELLTAAAHELGLVRLVDWLASRLHVATINKFEETVEQTVYQMSDFLEGLTVKARYIGASDEQVQFGGCDDPRDVLIEGEVYEVDDREVHTQHTKLSLVGFEGKFNSVCFEEV